MVGLVVILNLLAAHASNETVTEFGLKSCATVTDGAPVCVRVEAEEARRSPMDRSYAFRRAKITIREATGPTQIWRVDGGYYDPLTGYLIAHGRPGGIINLTTGRRTLIYDEKPRAPRSRPARAKSRRGSAASES